MIRIRSIVEIAGFPKNHIEKTMSKVINNLKEDNEIKVIKTAISETTQVKEIWSTFAEFELEFSDIKGLLNFAFDYTPSLIEIINPEKLDLESKEIEDFLNDLLTKLHKYSMVVTSLNSENQILKSKLTENAENKKFKK